MFFSLNNNRFQSRASSPLCPCPARARARLIFRRAPFWLESILFLLSAFDGIVKNLYLIKK